jgi:predicted metal-dependent hydrolase
LFNVGEYFEAHEVLEHAWNEDTSAARDLYRAIVQVAVAYLQMERGNYRGAVKMFLRMRQWFAPLPEVCRGVDVAGLREAARDVEERLLALGEEGMGGWERELFQPVQIRERGAG